MIRRRYKIAYCKKISYYLFLGSLVIVLYACPFSSPYKLDNEPSVPVDEMLLGKWATMIKNKSAKELPVQITLARKNEMEYTIDFIGNFNNLMPHKLVTDDSVRGSAYISIAANKQLLCVELKGQTYISELIYRNDSLSLMPLADGFTAKYIKSNAQLRNAVEFHFKTRVYPCFDELFCLKGMTRVN